MQKISLTDAVAASFARMTLDASDWRKFGRIAVFAGTAWALVMGAVVYQTNGFYLGMSARAHADECFITSSMGSDYSKLACRVSSGEQFDFSAAQR